MPHHSKHDAVGRALRYCSTCTIVRVRLGQIVWPINAQRRPVCRNESAFAVDSVDASS
jgi:hypothetical protein